MRAGRDPVPQLEAASRDLLQVVKKDPKSSKAHDALAKVYALWARDLRRRNEDGEKEARLALKHYDRAVGLSPGYYIFRLNRAITAVTLAEILLAKKEDPRQVLNKALGDCDEIIRRAPKRGRTHAIRARVLKQLGDAEDDAEKAAAYYERSVADAKVAVGRNPRDGSAHLCMGQARLALKQYAEALKSLETADRLIGGKYAPLKGYLEAARKGLAEQKGK
jgi:tetratricopeptide (TPR) repeat protein